MKCTISGANSRIFSKAIQSIARIGSDVFIEADTDGMSIKTVNKTKSAFVRILFQPDFFTDFTLSKPSIEPSADPIDGEDEYVNKCKLSFKACLHAFRNMRQVEECRIKLDSRNAKLKIRLKCRLETTKTHLLWTLEQETLQSVYTTENCPNVLTASHKLFDEIVCNFPANEEELTIEAHDRDIVVRNYVDGSHVDRRYTRTQMTVQGDEFLCYQINEPTSITFSLKEFRAILNFAHALKLDVSLIFETSGKPAVIVVRNASNIEINLVMATLHPDEANDCTNNESMAPGKNNVSRKRSKANPTPTESYHINTNTADLLSDDADATFLSVDLAAFPDRSAHSILRQRSSTRPDPPDVRFSALPNDTTCHSLPTTVDATPRVLAAIDTDDVSVEFCEESEDLINNALELPPSPTAHSSRDIGERRKRQKLMRHIFRPCFEPASPIAMGKVLAYGSDEEEMRA